ncbi:hypothetical protein [Flavobacterium sp. W21_SRS_FM6]|uniref:hypothetical protein n=1 Tax=Flavobacterium sp. W21_SRS_FM6 TaxID=3240268 RepID=UPI003F915FBD
MLINTVILFLRDALPIFVLIGLLLGQVQLSKRVFIGSLFAGLACSLIFIQQVDVLGEMFAGTGLEITLWCLHFFIYCLVVLLGVSPLLFSSHDISRVNQIMACGLLVLIIVAKGTNFLLYFNGYLNQQNALQSMLIGTLLGLGICLSLAILLYFFTHWLNRKNGVFAPWLVLLVFATGQLVNAINLLVQVDVISDAAPIWNTQWLVDNESEYGHLLNVLIGYAATPTTLQIGLYLPLIIFPIIARYWWNRIATQTHRGESQ